MSVERKTVRVFRFDEETLGIMSMVADAVKELDDSIHRIADQIENLVEAIQEKSKLELVEEWEE